MTTAERITEMIRRLPPPVQQEVLDFAEFLAEKGGGDAEWSGFSLDQAMRGLENEEIPEYSEADLKEKWACENRGRSSFSDFRKPTSLSGSFVPHC